MAEGGPNKISILTAVIGGLALVTSALIPLLRTPDDLIKAQAEMAKAELLIKQQTEELKKVTAQRDALQVKVDSQNRTNATSDSPNMHTGDNIFFPQASLSLRLVGFEGDGADRRAVFKAGSLEFRAYKNRPVRFVGGESQNCELVVYDFSPEVASFRLACAAS